MSKSSFPRRQRESSKDHIEVDDRGKSLAKFNTVLLFVAMHDEAYIVPCYFSRRVKLLPKNEFRGQQFKNKSFIISFPTAWFLNSYNFLIQSLFPLGWFRKYYSILIRNRVLLRVLQQSFFIRLPPFWERPSLFGRISSLGNNFFFDGTHG